MRPPPRPRRVAPVRPERVAPHEPPRETVRPGAPSVLRPPVPRPPAESAALVPARPAPPVRRPTVVEGSADRFAERVELRRRLTRRRAVWTGAVAIVVAAAGWTLFWSPVLALDVADVELAGQGTVVDPAAVMAVVAPHDGTPLPRLDTVELRRAILDVPGVRAVEVARVWPHGLRITVQSREPVAAVPDQDGYLLLDVEGVQVGRVVEPPAGLPVIDVPVTDEDALAMTAVLAVLEQLPPELTTQVAAASAETRDTVRLVLTDGALVDWGSADQTALKATVLLTLRSAPASAGAAVFDVSAPTTPITRAQP